MRRDGPGGRSRGEAEVELEPGVAAVRDARAFVRRALGGWECDRPTTELAALLTSELATNAVVHARSPLRVKARLARQGVVVEVGDRSAGRPTLGKGRGLECVHALSQGWGVRTTDGGKCVWSTLTCVPARAHGAAPS